MMMMMWSHQNVVLMLLAIFILKCFVKPHVVTKLIGKRFLVIFSHYSIIIVLFFLLFSDSHNLPRKPPLDLILGQAQECLKLMSDNGLGACAFASVEEYM